MNSSFEWLGGIGGDLVVENRRSLRTTADSVQYARESAGFLSEEDFRRLGKIVFFIALREFGRTNNAVLPRVEKALDAFYPVLPERRSDSSFHAGMQAMRDRLFLSRGERYEILLALAFDEIRPTQGEKGQVRGSR